MRALRYTLLSDGGSERALLHVLTWLLRENLSQCAIDSSWADLRRLPHPPSNLSDRICRTLELYPCDLLFVHRDAERASPESRLAEIADALKKARSRIDLPPAVCVVPVRMQEAWLLFDVQAIRKAAGNPNGRAVLNLPRVGDLETKPNPKKLLNELLCRASELKGRHLKRFKRSIAPARVAEFIDDFGPLRDLCAFKKLEDDIKEIVASGGW